MDYQVAFFQDSWKVQSNAASSTDIIKQVLDTRDAAIRQLRLPGGQEGKIDDVSCGIWLKVRTDRPRPAQTTTAFVSVKDKGLHRLIPFSYPQTPLRKTEIRLLELLPGDPAEELHGHLHVFSLDHVPSYCALSYVWGSPTATNTMLLGPGFFKRERITKNLHSAFCKLRLKDKSRFLWVDAVCIDQRSTEEVSKQVQMMGTIFASASQVIVWLGESTEDVRLGMKMLQYVADGKAFEKHPPWETQPPELLRKGLDDVLHRSWFTRVWTVQEAALSSQRTTMLCEGGEFVTWPAHHRSVSMFIRGLKYAAVTAQWSENGFSGAEDLGLKAIDLGGIINLLGQQLQQIQRRQGLPPVGDEPDLLDIAYEVKDKYCTDPRDRLYAIQGLALIRGTDLRVQPDYSKSLQEVQEDFRRILRDAARRNSVDAMVVRDNLEFA